MTMGTTGTKTAIPLQSSSIEHDTLEEAFLALLQEHERIEA
jgi:hypothetical protein